jgi:hypothetical protein
MHDHASTRVRRISYKRKARSVEEFPSLRPVMKERHRTMKIGLSRISYFFVKQHQRHASHPKALAKVTQRKYIALSAFFFFLLLNRWLNDETSLRCDLHLSFCPDATHSQKGNIHEGKTDQTRFQKKSSEFNRRKIPRGNSRSYPLDILWNGAAFNYMQ